MIELNQLSDKDMFTQLLDYFEELSWSAEDNIVVEIGGTQVSGIHQGEEYNKKWAAQYGDRKYNKDAFIVIKNLSRNDDTKSQPMDREHTPHHGTPTTATTTRDTRTEGTDTTDSSGDTTK